MRQSQPTPVTSKITHRESVMLGTRLLILDDEPAVIQLQLLRDLWTKAQQHVRWVGSTGA